MFLRTLISIQGFSSVVLSDRCSFDYHMSDLFCSLLLKAVSGEDTQDRTDRAILTPWVKFLWESYRQCLDLLRNNSKVEKLYQDIAQQGITRNSLQMLNIV